jgi:hypothetical protein
MSPVDDEPQIGDAPRRHKGPNAPLPTATGVSEQTKPEPALSAAAVPAEEDPRIRAARRTAELLDDVDDLDEGSDDFYIDQNIVPEGWTYEWKRHKTLGAVDPSYEVSLARAGWQAVPVTRHSKMMPLGWTGAMIERKGMILMERPTEIVKRARSKDDRRAREQVGAKEAQVRGAPAGANSPFEGRGQKLGKSYEPLLPVPKD